MITGVVCKVGIRHETTVLAGFEAAFDCLVQSKWQLVICVEQCHQLCLCKGSCLEHKTYISMQFDATAVQPGLLRCYVMPRYWG